MSDLRSFLVRTALDDAFRDLTRDDPDAAFEGYALTDAQKAVLRRPDQGWLALMGEVIRAQTPPVDEAPPSQASAPGAPALPEARVLLAFRPQVRSESEGTLGWAVSLHPWPSDADADALRLIVRVAPGEGGFVATIHPAPAAGAPDDPSPWDPARSHAADPDRIRLASTAVREATPEQRYARIRELLAVVTGER